MFHTVLQRLHLKIFEDCNSQKVTPKSLHNGAPLKLQCSNQTREKAELEGKFCGICYQIDYRGPIEKNCSLDENEMRPLI